MAWCWRTGEGALVRVTLVGAPLFLFALLGVVCTGGARTKGRRVRGVGAMRQVRGGFVRCVVAAAGRHALPTRF